MAFEFFNDGTHRCVRFDDLAGEGEVQTNQTIIIHGERGVLLEPGGNKLFSRLVAEMSTYIPPQKLDYIILSHQDPDVGAGLNGYLLITDARICFPSIWLRFIPAFCTKSLAMERVISIPDEGMRLDLNGAELILLPAHFLHSSGNIHVYDVVSKTLFSSDLGAAMLPPDKHYVKVEDFDAHVQYMEGFHKRYIPSGKACRQWAAMVRQLDIERIVPQHGPMFEGQEMVARFIDWVSGLKCGLDYLAEGGAYRIPAA